MMDSSSRQIREVVQVQFFIIYKIQIFLNFRSTQTVTSLICLHCPFMWNISRSKSFSISMDTWIGYLVPRCRIFFRHAKALKVGGKILTCCLARSFRALTWAATQTAIGISDNWIGYFTILIQTISNECSGNMEFWIDIHIL